MNGSEDLDDMDHLDLVDGLHRGHPPVRPAPAPEVRVDLGAATLRLLPERAALVESSRSLLVADLHVDKSAWYRRRGVPIPEGILEESLARLERAIARTAAREVIVLGDLLHDRRGPDEDSRLRMREWRRRHSLPMRLVGGNHDRAAAGVLEEWSIEPLGGAHHLAGGPSLRHDPADAVAGATTVAGHLHPMASLAGGSRRLLLPCFHLRGGVLVLPALTAFASGVRVLPREGDRIFAIAESRVIEVPAAAVVA